MLCLLWHVVMPLWHYYHTLISITYITKDYAKNKIFMTSSQFLISKMVVLCIIIEKNVYPEESLFSTCTALI